MTHQGYVRHCLVCGRGTAILTLRKEVGDASYQGNAPAIAYISTPAVQQFSGNGSTTTFTLNRTVADKQSVLVSVDGVVQDAASAYTVPDGTTLTFTAAPSSGTNNIFVNFLDLTAGSVTPPAGQG